MNSTNSAFNKNPSLNVKNSRFIIKNNPSIRPNLVGSNAPQSLQDNLKRSLDLNHQQSNYKPVRPSSKNGIQEKVIRVNPKEEVVPRKMVNKAEFFNNDPTPAYKPEINLDDYVKKSKYEELEKRFSDLQKKYELGIRMNTELKEKTKLLESDNQKQSKKLSDALRENRRLEELVEELEEKNNRLKMQSEQERKYEEDVDNEEEEEEEERKDDHNDAHSLRLAMRYEVENRLLNQLSQLAAMRMLFERPAMNEPAEIDFNKPETIDPDRMTYEQLLQLGEHIGKVSKGLTKEQIKTIPKHTYNKHENKEDVCSICFSEFEIGNKVRKLACSHEYHSKCIKQWFTNEKTCPMCNKEVMEQ